MNNRRKLVIALSASVSIPTRLFAQEKKPLPLVGVLTLGSGSTGAGGIPVFREELAARGWKHGSQVTIAALNAEGSYDRLPVLAEALAKKNPAVIVATTTRVVAVAAKAAPRTPVVMLIVADPVASGFAASLARPGGMLTGISNASADTVVKFVELLVTAKPGLRQIGFLSAVSAVSRPRMLDSIRRSAAQYSVEVSIAEVKQRDEIDPALSQLAKQGMQALAIVPAPLPTVARKEILQFAAGQRWPVIAISRQWVDDGALLSYGADNESQFRRAAYFVDRILRGAKPADLPIELPTTFEMAVNLKTAKALGLTMPPEIMVRATRVIQ
jgi:putative ABC transport system substrate-binding protein